MFYAAAKYSKPTTCDILFDCLISQITVTMRSLEENEIEPAGSTLYNKLEYLLKLLQILVDCKEGILIIRRAQDTFKVEFNIF